MEGAQFLPLLVLQISFGKILSPIGIGLMSYGFGAFFGLLPGGDISSIMLIYGFPISLLGFALAYAQLKPVPCKTTKAAFDLREREMTDIQKQVRPQQHGLASATSALSCLMGNTEHITAGMQLLCQRLRLLSAHSCRALQCIGHQRQLHQQTCAQPPGAEHKLHKACCCIRVEPQVAAAQMQQHSVCSWCSA